MGDFTTLLYRWNEKRKLKKSLVRIENENTRNKGIINYQASDIEAFIERDPHVGSYLISGGVIDNRAKVLVGIAACSIMQNVPVIILHEGNMSINNHLQQLGIPSSNLQFIHPSSENYDPFYNRSSDEISTLCFNAQRETLKVTPIGQQYIKGISDFLLAKGVSPFIQLFVKCPFDDLFEKVDAAYNKGRISETMANTIKTELIQGQAESANVRALFADLTTHCSGTLYQRRSGISPCNIRSSIVNNGVIAIDVGSGANETIMNLLICEIREAVSNGVEIMLIIDNIGINSALSLNKLLKSVSSRCHTTIAGDDVYSLLGSDENLFNSFVGNANQNVIFTHSSGAACTRWAEIIGHYDEKKISQNQGSTRHTMRENNPFFPWQGGYAAINQYSFSTSREYIVRPEELARMSENEVYIIDQTRRELLHALIN